MLPLVLSHELAHPFKFWYENELHEGMCSGKELYRLVEKFAGHERQKAFGIAVQLAEQGCQICVTCMRAEYCVWVSSRSKTPQLRTLETTLVA
jgi:hypothetical protein